MPGKSPETGLESLRYEDCAACLAAMNESVPYPRIVRFGVYELDLASEELRKGGLKIRLSGQPFQILAMLLERPGEGVTREQLQKKLWPDGTFVDFDHSLNTAINKIREALGDSAENPRFVETLARRGYRFIATVEVTGSNVLPENAASAPALRAKRRPFERLLIATGVLLVPVVGVAFWWFSHRVSQMPSPLKLTRLTSDSRLTTDAVISCDGKLVAFASDRGREGNLDIWVKQAAGGEPIRLTRHPADDSQPDFSPEGSQIVFRSERDGGGIYLISALGGGQERLLAPRGRNPRFSPDGSRIAYWTGIVVGKPLGVQAAQGSLFVMAPSGGTPISISSRFVSAGCPIWSPDGKYLFFYGNPESLWPHTATDSDWWVVSREGGKPVKTGAFGALTMQQIESRFPSVVPLATQWIENLIFFYARLGDSVNLWQVPITSGTWQVVGPAQRLTSGSGLEIRPSLAKDGTLVFSSLSENSDLWCLPFDTNRAGPTPRLEQLSEGNAAEYSPAISADGKTVVFVSDRSGNPDIWMRNLNNGQDVPLTSTQESEAHPEISPDGSLVAYFVDGRIQTVPTLGGVTEVLCQGCGYPWNFTSDNRHLAFNQFPQVYLLDIPTKSKTSLLKPSGSATSQAKFSPDGRWITFGEISASVGGRFRLFVAPFQPEGEIPEEKWIALTDDSTLDDKPRWSPDGNLMYFTSKRDGFVCLWAQRLDPASKRPRDAPFVVYHLHQARRSLGHGGYYEISVARDKIVFNLGELAGNVWMAKLELK